MLKIGLQFAEIAQMWTRALPGSSTPLPILEKRLRHRRRTHVREERPGVENPILDKPRSTLFVKASHKEECIAPDQHIGVAKVVDQQAQWHRRTDRKP